MPMIEKELQRAVEESPVAYSSVFRSAADRFRPEGYIVETTKVARVIVSVHTSLLTYS